MQVRRHQTPSPSAATAVPDARRRATHHRRVVVRSLLVDRLRGVGDARQVIAVTSAGYGTSYAELRAFQRTTGGWRQVFGAWPARIGYNGFAPAGQKREGDGRTPTGSFGFQFMFGVNPDPGVRFHYRRAVSTSRWDDDPRSVRYNEWVDTRTGDPGRSPESMHQVPAYLYGAVIGYNTSRRPGLGSAIFLHVSHVGATSGCVSIPESELLAVLRWLDPRRHPRIVMGTTAAVTR
jgi:L,D-peptidoglycan transpeptidase YkuD (ErfK/YbiS/YcfS/YnhG family)